MNRYPLCAVSKRNFDCGDTYVSPIFIFILKLEFYVFSGLESKLSSAHAVQQKTLQRKRAIFSSPYFFPMDEREK